MPSGWKPFGSEITSGNESFATATDAPSTSSATVSASSRPLIFSLLLAFWLCIPVYLRVRTAARSAGDGARPARAGGSPGRAFGVRFPLHECYGARDGRAPRLQPA